jgi:hypothetical protein
MLEYFFGIELLRPVLLWIANRARPRSARLRQMLLAWLPYLVIDLAYVAYRASYSRIYGFEGFGEMTFFSLPDWPAECEFRRNPLIYF